MRFFLFLTAAAISAAFFCGCTAHYKMINGERIEVLSPEEEIELKSVARTTLAKSKLLTSRERETIKAQQPSLKIRYTGNRMGDATVSWKLPGKTVSLFMRGVFFDPSAQWMMKVRNDHPEIIDQRYQRTPKVEKR